MENPKGKMLKQKRSLNILAMVNVVIWAIAIIAMVILGQDSPATKKLFPILAGGVAVGISLISTISNLE